MPGVPRELAEHRRQQINEGSKPMKQRLRRFSPDKKAAIKKEITKLMASKPSSSTEKEYGRVAHVCRLHRSQQTLPERSIRATMH